MYHIKNTSAFVGEAFKREDEIDLILENGCIAKIGRRLKSRGTKVIDGRDFFVTPGFVNAHFHPSQQVNRGVGIGLTHDQQMDILHGTNKLKKPGDKYCFSTIAVLEGLKAGTTCFYSVGSDIEDQAQLFNTLGVRACCTMIPKDIEAPRKHQVIRARVWETRERLRKAEQLHKKYHSELVRIHFGVCNVRYATDELILGMLALAKKYGVYFHMHVAESVEYVLAVKKRTGRTPVQHLKHLGALSPIMSFAHAVHLTPREIQDIAASGGHVVHCPRANSYVAVGVCPVRDLLEKGVNVAFGSDAAINNNSNEVRGEARALWDKLSDRYGRTDIVDYLTLFKMLTINGARAMGLAKQIGTISQGKKADLVLWSKNDLPFVPGHNYLADLIFTESCRAHTVFIDGVKVLYNYKSTKINERKVIKKARSVSRKYYAVFEKGILKHI